MVQGVGFRPFVYRLAGKYNLKGEVCNTSSGVNVVIQCNGNILKQFIRDIKKNSPLAAQIKSIHFSKIPVNGYSEFRIVPSDDDFNGITEISPDIAVCDECISDMAIQVNRINYPLINCTHCGPRFTIVKELPYDRNKTTMKDFVMCENCFTEYHSVSNRRFHAQPVACNICGPKYTYRSENCEITSMVDLLDEIWSQINHGNILAIKGLGGYHLMCDALNNESVETLRFRKGRDHKPFAVLFRDFATVKDFCHVGKAEEEVITSWRRPIVLLKQKKPLAFAVNSGLNTVGAMLPYMPFHYLLFQGLKTDVVVLTSGNISDNPIITDDMQAENLLRPITSLFVGYNREIYNRTDDSVVKVIGGKVSMIRRSRGYVPAPVDLDCHVDGTLALGAEQKNTFCIGKNRQAILSQHIGDLKGIETFSFYKDTIQRFSELFRFKPDLLVCDLHPDYLSTVHAGNLARELNIPLCRVQHHHAHIVSCMAEHQLDEKIIGVCLDGTGFGLDGHTWGGEFFVADRADFLRYAHFEYMPMPGADMVIDEPWRMALSYLHGYPETRNLVENLPCFREIETIKIALVREMIDKQINSPLTSGAGRLFDAVAALTGLCCRTSFEAEPPMRLESLVIEGMNEHYPYTAGTTISFGPMFGSIIKDMDKKEKLAVISTKFHNTIANAIAAISKQIRDEQGIGKVVLSGGVFQNKYLLEKSVSLLDALNFEVFTNHLVPANDGGIALGQLVIANKKRMLCV